MIVKKIDTKEQIAKIFTIGLGPSTLFSKLVREKFMGFISNQPIWRKETSYISCEQLLFERE
jgi:hypothetical protein